MPPHPTPPSSLIRLRLNTLLHAAGMISLRLWLRPDKEGKTLSADVSAEAHSEVGSSVERRRVRATAQFRFDTPSACG